MCLQVRHPTALQKTKSVIPHAHRRLKASSIRNAIIMAYRELVNPPPSCASCKSGTRSQASKTNKQLPYRCRQLAHWFLFYCLKPHPRTRSDLLRLRVRLQLALGGRLLLLIAVSDHDECHTRRRGVKGQDKAARYEAKRAVFRREGYYLWQRACVARRLRRHEKRRE
jgi:hypothetical protein